MICIHCVGSVLPSACSLDDCVRVGKVCDGVWLATRKQAIQVHAGHCQENGRQECACPLLQELHTADLAWWLWAIRLGIRHHPCVRRSEAVHHIRFIDIHILPAF